MIKKNGIIFCIPMCNKNIELSWQTKAIQIIINGRAKEESFVV